MKCLFHGWLCSMGRPRVANQCHMAPGVTGNNKNNFHEKKKRKKKAVEVLQALKCFGNIEYNWRWFKECIFLFLQGWGQSQGSLFSSSNWCVCQTAKLESKGWLWSGVWEIWGVSVLHVRMKHRRGMLLNKMKRKEKKNHGGVCGWAQDEY